MQVGDNRTRTVIPVSERASQREGVAHPSAVAQTKLKTATGGCGGMSVSLGTLSATRHQNAQINAKTDAHPSGVKRTKTKTATGGSAERRREGKELGQPNSIRARQGGAKVLHIRAQLHGQEPKQQLADVPRGVGKARNSVSRTASERGKTAQRCCTSERSCTDKNQNSYWRKCQRGVGKARNSVSQTASERGKAAQRCRTSERSCTDKNQNSYWRMYREASGRTELGQLNDTRTRQVR